MSFLILKRCRTSKLKARVTTIEKEKKKDQKKVAINLSDIITLHFSIDPFTFNKGSVDLSFNIFFLALLLLLSYLNFTCILDSFFFLLVRTS